MEEPTNHTEGGEPQWWSETEVCRMFCRPLSEPRTATQLDPYIAQPAPTAQTTATEAFSEHILADVNAIHGAKRSPPPGRTSDE